MAVISTGQELTLRWDGHGFVPSEPLDFREGEEVTVRVVSVPKIVLSEGTEMVPPAIGLWSSPKEFDWDLARDQYEDEIMERAGY